MLNSFLVFKVQFAFNFFSEFSHWIKCSLPMFQKKVDQSGTFIPIQAVTTAPLIVSCSTPCPPCSWPGIAFVPLQYQCNGNLYLFSSVTHITEFEFGGHPNMARTTLLNVWASAFYVGFAIQKLVAFSCVFGHQVPPLLKNSTMTLERTWVNFKKAIVWHSW